jgi:prolipoprotein diacylglyceryltransferase
VQAYAALCFLSIAIGLILWLPHRRQDGDLAGIFLMSTGTVLFVTEFWRDPIGRGALFHGALKGPQVAAVVFVIAGAALLLDRASQRIAMTAHPTVSPPSVSSEVERPSHG